MLRVLRRTLEDAGGVRLFAQHALGGDPRLALEGLVALGEQPCVAVVDLRRLVVERDVQDLRRRQLDTHAVQRAVDLDGGLAQL